MTPTGAGHAGDALVQLCARPELDNHVYQRTICALAWGGLALHGLLLGHLIVELWRKPAVPCEGRIAGQQRKQDSAENSTDSLYLSRFRSHLQPWLKLIT